MDNTFSFTLRGLAEDEHAWRIDWFGSTTYAERYRRPSQPLIELQISQVPDNYQEFDVFFNARSLQNAKTKKLRLPVGFLPMLKIGDIWRNGKFWKSPEYQTENFSQLRINRDNCSLIKAGLPDEETGWYHLPYELHPYHMQFTQSYCLYVEHEGKSIIVPCTELLRFYFGSSSVLISRLLDAPFNQSNFWIGQEERDAVGQAKIQLSAGMPGRSATDIGRIAFSPTGRRAAELIGNSCIAATARGEPAFLKAIFPFTGSTDLSVSGIWLPKDGSERGAFLVFKLMSCSHRFPFSKLRYTSEQATQRSPQPTNSHQTSSQPLSNPKFSMPRQDSKILSDIEPHRAKQPRGLALQFGHNQFPDLSRKPVSRIENDAPATILFSQSGLTIIDSSSVGGEGSLASIQPVELLTKEVAEISEYRNFSGTESLCALILGRILLHVAQLTAVLTVETVRLSKRQRFDHVSTMPQIVDSYGELNPCCLINEQASKTSGRTTTRIRKISIGRATEINRICYFLLPEPRADEPLELHMFLDTSRSIRTTEDLLAAIAMHFSKSQSEGAPIALHDGVTSVKLIALPSAESSLEDAGEVLSEITHYLLCSALEVGEPSKRAKPDAIPEYLR